MLASTLKPLCVQSSMFFASRSSSRGDAGPLRDELAALKGDIARSALHRDFAARYAGRGPDTAILMNSLRPACIAEKALLFLFSEQNLVPADLFARLVRDLDLDRDYLRRRLADCRRDAAMETT